MLGAIFPPQFDNHYRGGRLALLLLGTTATAKVLMGFNVMLNGRDAAVSADGMPLDTYSPAGAEAVLAFFALWGLGQAILAVVAMIVLVRYRTMAPLLFVILLTEHIGRKLLFMLYPLEGAGTSASFWINAIFLSVLTVGLVNSVMPRKINSHA